MSKFIEAQMELDSYRVKRDLSTLAKAWDNAVQLEQEVNKVITRVEDLKNRIALLALRIENGERLDDEVLELYKEARR